MESLVMMALGDYRFGLSTAAYQSLDRDTAWRWPAIERIGAHPRLQFVGKGEDTLRLAGVVYPHFAGGLGQVDAMREEADKGEALRLVCGRGRVWGWWAITGLREGQRVFWSNGAPRAQEFDLNLTFYGERPPKEEITAYLERTADIRAEREEILARGG